MTTYLAFLRGINVGGNSLIKMAELKEVLAASDLADVRTYIQSGNIIFTSEITDTDKLAQIVQTAIKKAFNLDVGAAVFTAQQWRAVVAAAPKWWGVDKTWKHNLIIMLKPYDMQDVVAAIGTLKPDIEAVQPGEGVLYQSLSFKLFGRTTSGKIASNPVYKKMTIRNYNTATKLLALLPN